MKRIIVALLLAGMLPVAASARPAFLPLRDVTVNYELSGPGRPAADYRLEYSAAGQLARVDDPAHGTYFLVNLPSGTAELVVPALRSIVTAPDLSGLTQEIYSADGARFTPLGHAEYAGIGCETYLVLNQQDTGTACLTADGVALHFHGQNAHGTATVTAISVSYAPLPQAEFAMPDGFNQISLPPQALAQLLGQ